MSTTYHTDVSVGAANNASVVNTPLGQLDAALVALHTQTDTSLAALLTTIKTSVQAAMNELYTRLAGISNADGTLKDGAVSSAAKFGAGVVDSTALAAAVAGNGLSGGGGSALAVNVDASTIEINTDALRIKDLGVPTAKLADSAVTTAKIADANVTTAKLLDANVTTAKLADANVTTVKILDANVTTAKILDANVTTAKVADGAITAAKIDQQTLLKDWAGSQAFDTNGTPTFDTTWPTVVSSVTVIWPDGTGGTYTATSINATWGMVDAYTVTYTGSPTKTVTQAAVTRDSQGRVTTRPTLTVT
jgi:hypothetical protein